MQAKPLVTAEDLWRMGERDYDFELVAGRLVPVTPAGGRHGAVAARLTGALVAHVEAHGLGVVYVAETGYVLRRNPDTVRAPDLSFVSRERPAGREVSLGFIEGPPDLAIEVRSLDDTMAELTRKAEDYLAAGARLVWVVRPERRKVDVHRPGLPVGHLGDDGTLDGYDVVPGFRLPLGKLFAGLC
jgi:Uma2 family endonuclease